MGAGEMIHRIVYVNAVALTIALCGIGLYVAVGAQGQAAPRYK